MKEAKFVGSSLDDLRAWPKSARMDMGRQINRLQRGLDPNDWKPMRSVGRGVREIRVRSGGDDYRGMYVTSIGDAVYILHVFVKKSQATPARDMQRARSRLKALHERLGTKS